MKAKIKAIFNLILPDKKVNRFVLVIFIIGFISGCFFLTIISTEEKTIIADQITNFIANINNNTLNNITIFKNNLISNLLYIIILWILGLSIIGIIINIFLIYLKGFILGFTISSIVLTYKIKGILFNLIYVFPNELLKILMLITIGVYSLTLSISILREILKKNNNKLRTLFKRYTIILIISIFLCCLTSLFEAFVLPNILNLVY
jgi:stage II sporulation protein M